MNRVKYVTKIAALDQIPPEQRELLEPVSQRYVFRANDYYMGLIDWNDPADPIKKLVVSDERELNDWGQLDASNEVAATVARGCQHRYPDTALLLVNDVCGAYCRYCFRKRPFMNDNDEASIDIAGGLEYISSHPEITNVLLVGGDPLIMSTRRIIDIIATVREIPHVSIIRIGTKMPAFNPWRILDDDELVEGLSRMSTRHKRIYVVAHFDHPRELTEPAVAGLDRLIRAGVICLNQCPLLRGINDDPKVLAKLYQKLSFIGVPPYYIFQGRPTAGNEPYEVPIVEGYFIVEEARKRLSGLAQRARFCMSHETGKIEILGVDEERIYLRYHRAKRAEDLGKFMVFHRDDDAYWLDQLVPYERPRPVEQELVAEPAAAY